MWGVRDFSASGIRKRWPVASQKGGFLRRTPSPCLTRLTLYIYVFSVPHTIASKWPARQSQETFFYESP